MSENTDVEEVFMMLFEIVDRLSQKGMATTARKNLALLESLTVRQEKTLFAVITLTKHKPIGINLKGLAVRMNITVPAASVLVETMVKSGLLEREVSPTDRRAVCIKISNSGKKIFDVIRQEMATQTNNLASVLSPEERDFFGKIVKRFYEQLF